MQFGLDLHPERTVFVAFFKDVVDVGSLHERMQSAGVGPVAILDASLVLHVTQVRAAASLAVENESNGRLLSGELHSEMIFCIGQSKNVQKSLDVFQISPPRPGVERGAGSANVVVVKFDATPAQVAAIHKTAGAAVSNLNSLDESCARKDMLARMFDVKPAELEHSTLLQSLVLRIATKFVR